MNGVSIVLFLVNILVNIFLFVIKIIYVLLMKLRLMGLFVWFVGLGIIYWDAASALKYEAIIPYYLFLGIPVLIGTVISMITAVVRYWKPGFRFLDLFIGTPEHMDIRYFQAITSLEELEKQYYSYSLTYDLDKDIDGSSHFRDREYRRMAREYEYLKRKFEKRTEQV
ncbi:MAG: hypothetical protein ACI4VG_06435 [Lachnospiraceae bacterium]